jgi:succinate dehydrogenase/fumarate reductase flavoprotein subunit
MSDHEVPSSWDEEADVVVVGSGFAGSAAAIAAHDAGANVLLIEKAPEKHKGGNSRVCAQVLFWPNDVEKAKTYFKAMTGPYMDNISEEMVHVWAHEMHANKAWLETLGMNPIPLHDVEFPEFDGSDCVQMLLHGDGPAGSERVMRVGGERLWKGVTEPALAKRKIRALYETGATNLVKHDGEIIGVIADQRGKRIAIKANRAVILTCGGFENNPAMIRSYITGLPHIYPTGTPYNTGDGIRMGMEIGADLWHMTNISGPEFFFKAPELPVSGYLNFPHAKNYIFVAGDGKRFTAEGQPTSRADRHGKVKYHGAWMQLAAPVPIYLIFDETLRTSGPIGKVNDDWDKSHGNFYDWSDDNLREIGKGWIKQADTIRELADLVGLCSDVLAATVIRYNAQVAAEHDADFDRAAIALAPIETGPFYAMELTPSFLNTHGGPRRNKDAQVISVSDKPIPRLYSAGELGSIYAFLYQGGGDVGECFAFGRIAGRNAAAQKPFVI